MHWNPVCEERKINFKVTSILYPSRDGLRYMLVFRYKTRPPSRHWNIRTNSYMSGKARILGALLYRVPPLTRAGFVLNFNWLSHLNTGKKARKQGPLPRLIKTKNVGGFMLLFKIFRKVPTCTTFRQKGYWVNALSSSSFLAAVPSFPIFLPMNDYSRSCKEEKIVTLTFQHPRSWHKPDPNSLVAATL